MNPYKLGYAWPAYLAAFIRTHYVETGQYDGVLLDILSEWEPTFASATNEIDIDEDGIYDVDLDRAASRAGQSHLLALLRADGVDPNFLLVGNGGVAWRDAVPGTTRDYRRCFFQ